ncbi:MAG: DUF2974 domain-containing protein [Clostridia bacterium]|nr:DUF2974 domain-containing protein [Clostridia bacterium]
MANIIDYVKWRGDISFSESPVNVIDSLIFSELSYIPYDDLVTGDIKGKGVPIQVLAEKYFSLNYNKNKLGAIIPTDQILELFTLCASSRRFSTVLVRAFVNEVDTRTEKQFCAMCFDTENNSTVITFRGTDDSIIGWKEDFNMAFFTPIPAQRDSWEYLTSVIENSGKRDFYVAGHSKGGNLAMYSSLTVKDKHQAKIKQVYSFDGPGFKKEFLEKNKDNQVVPKLLTVLPEGAIIGAIFDSIGEIKYIKSNAKGLYQHDAFSWELLGKEFIPVKGPNKTSVDFHKTLEKWVSQLTDKEKVEFVDALYKFCTVNESTTLTDIASDKLKFLIGVLKTDDKTKKTFLSSLNKLIMERYFKKEEKPQKKAKKSPKKKKPTE